MKLFPVLLFVCLFCGCNSADKKMAEEKVASQCPNPPLVVLSSDIPNDVCVPDGIFNNTGFFNDYSWKIFIALTWPAKDGQRGVADASKAFNAPGPKVFQTYKGQNEIFFDDSLITPSPWNQYDNMNPCGIRPEFGQLVLASYSKFSNLGQAGFGQTLTGPLACQNGTYTMYLTSFDQLEFNDIVGKKLYLKKNLTSDITFPTGSIDIKTSWIDMTGIVNKDRYYTTTAIVMDPVSGSCSKKLVGLVGMHIVHKTPSRPQWIWSTFEQVDNIKEEGAVAPYAYHNGKSDLMPDENKNILDPLTIPPVIYNVQRLKPLHPFTKQTNAIYQAACKKEGVVWQYYKLVMTQWPSPPNSPQNDGTPPRTIPGKKSNTDRSDTTAYSNITMETFEQSTIISGCMNCHNIVGRKTDFLFTLYNHAGPQPIIPNFMTSYKQLPRPAISLKSPYDKIPSDTNMQRLKAIFESTKTNAHLNKQ